MFVDPATLDNKEMYKFLIGGVAPRPIAWAGTRSKDGVNNLAPFSFYNAFSSTPPIVGFSTIPRLDGRNKDTLQNVIDKLVEAMSKSSALLEPGEDEFVYAGLEPAEAQKINAPYVKDAMLVFECELNQVVSFGKEEGSGNLILGQIINIRVNDEIYNDGYVDFEKLDPVGRLAGSWYTTIRDKFEIKRG